MANIRTRVTCAHTRELLYTYTNAMEVSQDRSSQRIKEKSRFCPRAETSERRNRTKKKRDHPSLSLSLSRSFSSISRVFLLVYGEERLSSLSGRRSIKIYSRAVKSSADFRLALPAKAAIFLSALSLSTFSPPSSEIYFLILACHG